MKRLFVAGAVVTAAAAIGAAAAGACVVPPPAEGGCGKGFTLVYNPSTTNGEGYLLEQNGHVNGDGYVCRQNHASPGGDIIVVDNVLPEQSHNF